MKKQNKLLFLDFETYYDDEYSLRKLTIPEYILDERFECIMCSVKEDNDPAFVVDGPDLPRYLAEFDLATTTTCTFNALFDNSILSWNYGFIPHRMFDSMGMMRSLRGHLLKKGASLAAVANVLGLPPKLDTIIHMKGKTRADIIAAGMWNDACVYANDDNEKNAIIFYHLINDFPRSERHVMDLVLRCATEPVFRVDEQLLVDHLVALKQEKDNLLLEIGQRSGGAHFFLGPEQKLELIRALMSNQRFALELEALGVQPGMKVSPTTQKKTFAFAKTDEFMAWLAEHEDPRVQALAAARLGHKSTLEETRAEKLLAIARLPWAHYRDGNPRLYSGGTMPIPLRFGGAHTHRLSGDWGLNMQNLPTVRGSKGKSKLRHSLKAPPGHKVLTIDLGQIEARLVAWLCRAMNLLKQFADNLDPYAILATMIFGFTVDRKVHIAEGFIGKTGILGLGYACGGNKFDSMVIKMARAMEVDISKIWVPGMAQKCVTTYRDTYPAIPQGWKNLDYIIQDALFGSDRRKFGPCEISYGKVALPNGMYLQYADLQVEPDGERTYAFGKFRHKIYGAKLLENIVQALARIIVMNAALRIRDRTGLHFKLQAHDELVYIIPVDRLDDAKKIIHEEMVRPPSWAPDIPLKADVGIGDSYGECK